MVQQNSQPYDRQGRITQALEDQSPRLAGLYRSALSLVHGKPEPGCEVARVSMVCHCMRELMMNLPGVMADGFIKERPETSSGTLVSQLSELLSKHPDLNLNLDQDMVPVPSEVAKHFSKLFKAAVQEEGRNQHNTAALINGGSDPQHPAVRQWKKAYRFFLKWAHLDQNDERSDALPSDQVLLSSIRVVEDVIEVRTTAFFDNLHAVSDLLAAANTLSEEDE